MAKFYVMSEVGEGKPADIVRADTRGEAFKAYSIFRDIDTMDSHILAHSEHDDPYHAYVATGEGVIEFYKDGKSAGTGKLGYIPSEPLIFSDDLVFLDHHPFDTNTGKKIYDAINNENFTKGEIDIDGSKYAWKVDISNVPYLNATDIINNIN